MSPILFAPLYQNEALCTAADGAPLPIGLQLFQSYADVVATLPAMQTDPSQTLATCVVELEFSDDALNDLVANGSLDNSTGAFLCLDDTIVAQASHRWLENSPLDLDRSLCSPVYVAFAGDKAWESAELMSQRVQENFRGLTLWDSRERALAALGQLPTDQDVIVVRLQLENTRFGRAITNSRKFKTGYQPADAVLEAMSRFGLVAYEVVQKA